jgi:hypothetical protein
MVKERSVRVSYEWHIEKMKCSRWAKSFKEETELIN